VNEWVLELKALCDKTSTTGNPVPESNIREAVEGGLEQAIGYKTSLHAVNAALCCFDMRATDEGDEKCFEHVANAAAAESVPLWRWYLYRSTKHSRAAKNYLKIGSA